MLGLQLWINLPRDKKMVHPKYRDITPDDIQVLADVALDILKKSETPCIEIEGVRQRYQVIITNWHEPEIIGMNKTPGMSSGEVFKPIIQGLDGPGRLNSAFNDQFF